MRLYQVNLPGGPVMVFAHTIQRAWIMAFTRYAYDCDPDPAFAWDATEEWLAASDGQQAHTRTTLDDMEEGVGIYDPDNGWALTVSAPPQITQHYPQKEVSGRSSGRESGRK